MAERLDVEEWLSASRRGRLGSDFEPRMERTRRGLEDAMEAISKELIWKVHFEAAQIEERTAAVAAREVLC